MKKEKYVVWYKEHYNKFNRQYDLVLTCDEAHKENIFPIQVFADDLQDAKDYCDMFFKNYDYELKAE